VKPTAKQYRDFVRQAQGWIKTLGLSDWRVTFYFKRCEDARATCQCDASSHVATICLSTDWGDDKPTDEQIRHSALHEVLHLLLADFRNRALARCTFTDDIDVAEHAVIWRVQQALLGLGT
jgi:hypothetical protein